MSATKKNQAPEIPQAEEPTSIDRTEAQESSASSNPLPGAPGSEKTDAVRFPDFRDPEIQKGLAQRLGIKPEEMAKLWDPEVLNRLPLDTAMGKNARMIMRDGPFNLREHQEILELFAEENGVAPLPPPSPFYEHTSRQREAYRRLKGLDVEEPTVDLKLTDILGVAFRGIHQEDSETSLSDLRRSIAEYGLLQPVLVVQNAVKQDTFFLIDGRRRLRVVTALGHKTIRATILALETPADAPVIHLISNCVRKNVSSFELATYSEELIRTHGVRVQTLAEIIGYTPAHIYSMLKCLQLPQEILTDWKAQHPYLTLRRMIAPSRKDDPVPTWIAMRANFDRNEHHLDDPPPDYDEPEVPREPRRPSAARLSKLRDFAARAELPSDPEAVRQMVLDLLDYSRGASAHVPAAFANALSKRRRASRVPPKPQGDRAS